MGEAAVRLFASEGAAVAAVDLDEAALAALVGDVRAAGGRAIAIAADVTCAADAIRIADSTEAAFGPPNMLFSNAGVDT